MTRTFQVLDADEGGPMPMIVALSGPPGGGKTHSALELATGMQAVTGGHIMFVDGEAGRSKFFSRDYKFKRIDLAPPFGGDSYLAAVLAAEDWAGRNGGKMTLIIDNMSNEHEGEGGVLDQFEIVQQQLAERWKCSLDKATSSAWAVVKRPRNKLINHLMQMRYNIILCFRAKEKTDWGAKDDRGRTKPEKMGWVPITPLEFVGAATVSLILHPHSGGVPTVAPQEEGERNATKLPAQLVNVFPAGKRITREAGEALARRALGSGAAKEAMPTPVPPSPVQSASPPGSVVHMISEEVQAQLKEVLIHRAKMEPKEAVKWMQRYFGVNKFALLKEAQGPVAIALAEAEAKGDRGEFDMSYNYAKEKGLVL